MAGNVATRRSSFRRSLIEAELPESYLEQLEAKRRQLDDSIHKYVASKEREYKAYEKDLKLRHTRAVDGDGHSTRSEEVGSTSARRRTSSESTQDAGDRVAVEALVASSSRRTPLNGGATSSGQRHERALPTRGSQSEAAASIESRRRSIEKNKDFVGLFTPPFLPALQAEDAEKEPHLNRHSSAPNMVGSLTTGENGLPGEMNRANSDTVVQAKMRRPAHLQLSQRTSSSGSSVDGKLISALKSPTDALRPKRKRVSLAVGDEIVAPSDSVPAMMERTNSTPSHSRVRAPVLEQRVPEEDGGPTISSNLSALARKEIPDVVSSRGRTDTKDMQPATVAMRRPGQKEEPSPISAASSLDADGDLFDLEESGTEPFPELPDMDMNMSETEDPLNEITGRIGNSLRLTKPEPPPTSIDELLVTESAAVSAASPPETGLSSDPVALSFNPRSAAQPSSSAGAGKIAAGFRRPSAAADPTVKGEDIINARRASDEASLYGSSFNKATTTASFTGGSLGESYMARHAEEMIRRREGRSRG